MAGKTGLTQALRAILQDGEWHAIADLYEAVQHMVPPESADRMYERWRLRNARRYSARYEDTAEKRIRIGKRALIQQALACIVAESKGAGWKYTVRGIAPQSRQARWRRSQQKAATLPPA